jgi:hypothetical protein
MKPVDQSADRSLGAEMIAEGWHVIGGDWIMWLHPPSERSVGVDGPIQWSSCHGIAAVPEAPKDPATYGYLVSARRHDEFGNPVDGDSFWIESYATALRHARRIRLLILGAERVPAPTQMTLDDVTELKS